MGIIEERKERVKWFCHDRFGMFIHWGLYAMPARHEWVKTHERTRDEVYDRYLKYFDPDLYDRPMQRNSILCTTILLPGQKWPRRQA